MWKQADCCSGKRLAAAKYQPTDANGSSISSESNSTSALGNLPKSPDIRFSNNIKAKHQPLTSVHSRLWFPLLSDHLLTLIQFNVYRATWINLVLVTPAAVKNADYLSELNILPSSLPSTIPPTLTPTILQRQIRHLAWIDAAPLATLRDNFIRGLGSYDEDALCLDLLGGLFHSDNGLLENNGMMVWTDPWNIAGWEMTERFARKWGFLLKGCREMFDATNYWRRMRQEDLLAVDIGTLDHS